MFLTRFKPICRISNLYYASQNQKILQRYKQVPSGPYNLPIKFIYAQRKPTRFNKFFLDGQLRSHFENIMSFIHKCAQNSPKQNRQQFPHIQETLQTRIESFVKSRAQKIIVHQCDVGRAFYIEEKKVHGVFFDRKLNLARSCYSAEFNQKTKQLKYRLRTKMTRAQDLNDIQRARNLFQSGDYNKKYRDTYEGFKKSQFITQSLIKIVADVKVEIQIPDLYESIRLGYEGPSQHVIQIETYKVPYQAEEYAITDVDFFMEGNPHFLKQKNQ